LLAAPAPDFRSARRRPSRTRSTSRRSS
jgi:hypothetical protein